MYRRRLSFSFQLHHPVSDPDMRLNQCLFAVIKLFAQCRHEHPQGGFAVIRRTSPHSLNDIFMCQNFSVILCEQTEQLIFDGRF